MQSSTSITGRRRRSVVSFALAFVIWFSTFAMSVSECA